MEMELTCGSSVASLTHLGSSSAPSGSTYLCCRAPLLEIKLLSTSAVNLSPVGKLKPTRKATRKAEKYMLRPDLPITLHELLRTAMVSPLLITGDANVHVRGIQHDSRLAHPGDLFICCRGFATDGHLHAAHAAHCGAVAIIASKPIPNLKDPLTFVLVEDTNSILSALSAAFYRHPSETLTVVGITGTNGKTTTSYLIRSVFEATDHKTGLLGTITYDVNGKKDIIASNTTPDALSLQYLMATMVQNDVHVCVMEVSSHALALGRCNMVDFDIAVFTNLTRDHMDFHETEEHYRQSKGLLFAKMVEPLQHKKVVNIDDPQAPYFIKQGSPNVPIVKYSLDNREADVFATDLNLSLSKTDVMIHTRMGQVHITSKLLGRHNVSNILAAVAVGVAADIPLDVIARGVEMVGVVPGRCELINEGQSFTVLVDYAHTPDALSRLLDTTRECDAHQIITVVGCGGDRDRGKRPIMAKVAADKSDICILTSDNPRTENPLSILKDMLAGVGLSTEDCLKHERMEAQCCPHNGHKVLACENRRQAIQMAMSMGKEGDAVVIAGKGHEDYQIIGDSKEHFDDREECRKALQQLGFAASQMLL